MAIKETSSIKGLKTEIKELSVLYEISQALNSSLDLENEMKGLMQVLHEKMGMEHGTISLLDQETNELNIEIAHGLDPKEKKRGRYQVGEGITGKVVAAGEAIVVPSVGDEPLFLNKTKARKLERGNISFICVPIKLENKTIGALSVDKLFSEEMALEEDVRLLTIISSLIGHAVRMYQKRQEEKEILRLENTRLKHELKKKFHPKNIIGESKRMADVYSSIELVSQTKATVIIRGESGTGKELVAHAIHYNSERSEGPFIKVSCAALPETLLESELFGYQKGAFSGAVTNKVGRFELANGGTLFLDEIGDISPSTQIKLLRVLQEKEFERLGGTETIKVDIRLITATNKDLEKEVKEGDFREDLYYRLNVVPIFLPSLRDRAEDVAQLVDFFLKKSSEENGKNVRFVSDEAMNYLVNYKWPGNVRELENAVERAVVLCQGDTLTQELFPIPGLKSTHPSSSNLESSEETQVVAGSSGNYDLTDAVSTLEMSLIRKALDETSGNQRKAAQMLGVTERILGYKIKNYKLK